jgi:hypothetical protein
MIRKVNIIAATTAIVVAETVNSLPRPKVGSIN